MSPGEAPLGRLWAAFFGYAASVALLVQLVLLPYVFPAWHAGDGLLVGGDSVAFHAVAASRAERIRVDGLASFEPAPDYQPLTGIASLVYAFTVPKPWTLVPLSAAVHATTAVVLVRILQMFVTGWRMALWAVLPFLLYPSTLSWIAQIHKDGFFTAGFLFTLYGWMRLGRDEPARAGWAAPVRAWLLILVGIGLMWLVRPYQTSFVQGIEGFLAVIVVGVCAVRVRREAARWRRVLVLSVVAGGLVLLPRVLPSPLPDVIQLPALADFGASTAGRPLDHHWDFSPWLPDWMERRAYGIALVREAFKERYPDARSNVDFGVAFHGVADILRYLPRATGIALLAPFPLQWLEPGSLPSTTVMRRVVAVEMLGVYLAILFLPVAIWLWRDRLELWLLVLSSFLAMEVFALAVPNLGALYRFRYGFIMLLVSMGLAGVLALRARLSRAVTTAGAEGASALAGEG